MLQAHSTDVTNAPGRQMSLAAAVSPGPVRAEEERKQEEESCGRINKPLWLTGSRGTNKIAHATGVAIIRVGLFECETRDAQTTRVKGQVRVCAQADLGVDWGQICLLPSSRHKLSSNHSFIWPSVHLTVHSIYIAPLFVMPPPTPLCPFDPHPPFKTVHPPQLDPHYLSLNP